MAKYKLYFLSLTCAVSGLLLTAFFISKSMPYKTIYHQTTKAILLSYIPPLNYFGEYESLTIVSLKQTPIFEDNDYADVFLEIESLQPIIDSVVYVPQQFKFV